VALFAGGASVGTLAPLGLEVVLVARVVSLSPEPAGECEAEGPDEEKEGCAPGGA